MRGQLGNYTAERNFLVSDASGDGADGMHKPLAFTYDEVTRDMLGLQVGGTAGSNMRSPQGRMSMELQEDGNLVVYDTSVLPWKAVWSIWTGLIP